MHWWRRGLGAWLWWGMAEMCIRDSGKGDAVDRGFVHFAQYSGCGFLAQFAQDHGGALGPA